MTTVLFFVLPESNPIGWSRQKAQNLASEVTHDVGYLPGGDLHDIVKRLGGQVV